MDNVTLKSEMRPVAALMQNAAARQLLAMLGIAASVALGVAVILWTRGPTYRVLYPNLEQEASAEVLAALQAANIDARIQEGSTDVEVPADAFHQARLALAREGLPTQAGTGLELMDRDPAFGLSQFMEMVHQKSAPAPQQRSS